jgi:hypothetical protein
MIRKPFALAFTLLVLGLPVVGRADSAPVNDPATQKTITDIRNVGTAMFNWYKNEMAPKRSEESHKKAVEAAGHATSVDINTIPAISRQDLAKVLVPRYIAAIPEQDGWGHPYDFHLDTKNPDAFVTMGLRSSGRDGKFSSSVYEVGSFRPDEVDQDIPWVDGYFVRWPEKK